ncbi:ArsR/SmtB family transcription factor [Streptococcus hongkongensis]|nr:hypothetical protein NC01_06945 [Streptococcus uberis]
MSDITSDVMLFKALSDINRLRILTYLQQGQICACELSEKLSIAQTALSYHMRILCQSGLVDSKQVGKRKHYQLSKKAHRTLLTLVGNYLACQDEQFICHCKRVTDD